MIFVCFPIRVTQHMAHGPGHVWRGSGSGVHLSGHPQIQHERAVTRSATTASEKAYGMDSSESLKLGATRADGEDIGVIGRRHCRHASDP